MTKEKTLVKKTAIYAVGNFGSKILAYVMVLVYSYFIAPKDMGYYDIILTTVAMIQPLVIFQLNDGVYRFLIDKNNKSPERTISTGLKFIFLTTLFSEVVLFVLSSFFEIRYAGWVAAYLATTIFYVFFQDAARGLGESKLYAFCGIANSLIMLIFEVIGLMVLDLGLLSLLISKVIANAACIAIIFFKRIEFRKAITAKFDKIAFSNLIKYSAPLVPNTICWWIVNSSDRYIILGFLGEAANGIYSMSNKFPTILTTVTSIFYLAWQESAIKEYDTPDRDKFFSDIFKKYSVLLFTLCICAIPATKIVIELFVSTEYKTAWLYTGFLYLAAVFSALCSFLGMGYQISKETKRSFATTVFAAFLNIGINVAAIKFLGLHAASFSTFAAYLFLFIIRLKHSKRYFILDIKWVEFLSLFAACLGAIALISFIDGLALCFVLCAVGAAVLIWRNMELVKPMLAKLHKKGA